MSAVCQDASHTSVAHINSRGRVTETLSTTSIEEARYKRDLLADADEAWWASLIEGEAGPPACLKTASEAARRRYTMATSRSQAKGFDYRPVDRLAAEASLEELVRRLEAVLAMGGTSGLPRARDAEALLGGAPKPQVRLSEAFDIYVREIA